MALTLVTGRANTGKTAVVHRALTDAVRAGQLPVLLLPTLPDVRRAREWLAPDMPLGVQIDQFERFVESLWATAGDGTRFVRGAQRAVLMADAIERSGSRLGASTRTPGFLRFAGRIARRLAEEPEWVLDQAEAVSSADAAVLALAREYLARLPALSLVEPGTACRRLAQDPPLLEGPVIAHDFSDLSVAQEALLAGWADSGRDVMLTLPWERGFAATEALDGLGERMFALADTVVTCEVPPRADVDEELVRLEAELFAAPLPAAGRGAVSFCEAVGDEAEAALIARRVRELVTEAEDADRVAVVFRDCRRHAAAVGRALAAVGVAADLDVRLPVLRTPFGLALSQVLRFQLSGGRSHLAGLLRGSFSGVDSGAVDRLERGWRRGREIDARRLAAAARGLGEKPGRTLSLARQVAETGEPRVWKELADHLLGVAYTPEDLQASADAALDVAAHRAVMETVASLSDVGRTSTRDVLAALEEVETTPAESERRGHVQVTEAHRLRARRFDSIVVGGMTAGEFSASGTVSAATEFVDRLFCVERPSEQARERLLFYTVVTRARKRLVFTRRTATAEGEPVRPSAFWEEVLDLFRSPSPDDERDLRADAVPREALGLADIEEAAPALSPGRPALRRDATRGDGAADARVAHAIERAGATRGELRDPETRAALAARDVFSATELETYAQCPYRWFYERVVRPERIDGELGPLERGDLAHRVLRTVYERLSDVTGSRRVTPATLDAALSLADDVFAAEAAPPRTPPPLTLAEEDDIAAVLRSVRDLLEADADFLAGFEPTGLEVGFGRGGEAAADLGGFGLKGSIDRIDQGEPGLAVIDYKSGRARSMEEAARKRLLQLPLYAAVAEARYGRPVVAALYRTLRDGQARGFFLNGAVDPAGLTKKDGLESAEDLRSLVADGVEAARRAVQGIRAAVIAPEDPAPGVCDFCAAAAFCPRGC